MANDEETKPSICPGCGASFVCGALAGLQVCWCMEKPSGLFTMEAGGSCYCPDCLDRRISELSSPAT